VHDAVLDVLRAAAAERLLDVGCGTGLLAVRVARELPGVQVAGCDFSRGMLARAATRSRRVWWVQGNAVRLPFRDRAFDAVVSTEAFHWFPDQAHVLEEFFRVLAPAGLLVVGGVNPPVEIVSRVARLASQLAGEPFWWPTRQQMRRWLDLAGFRVVSQRSVFRIPAGLLLPPVITVAERPA
jgi:ubiquinone/menaquinone biosynthesis C-methylase UbiE